MAKFQFFCISITLVASFAFNKTCLAVPVDKIPQWEAISDQKVYRAVISPEKAPIPVGKFHNWIVHIETAAGTVFYPKQLIIQGGMEGHGHGFPVEPEISRYLKNGDFLIEGVLFNMTGPWQLRFGINGPDGWDTVTLKLTVMPISSIDGKEESEWSQAELAMLKTLSWSSAAAITNDLSNRYFSNPKAAAIGKQLFFDKGLSQSKKVSCASCHDPEKAFTDGKVLGFGSAELRRHTPSLIGVVRNLWYYWDGRRDSLWAQAITPIESAGEMDNNRMDVVRYFLSEASYKKSYKDILTTLPEISNLKRFPVGATPYAKGKAKANWSKMTLMDRVLVNKVFSDMGKFIAAYEATLDYQASRFDRFVDTLVKDGDVTASEYVSDDEKAGIKLFLDSNKTQCLRCHNSALLTNQGFHNIGTGVLNGKITDYGRIFGLQAVAYDKFNCLGKFSDTVAENCHAMRFALKKEVPTFYEGAFKVPSLRGVAKTAPYMHDGRFLTLIDVINHYRKPSEVKGELVPIDLSEKEVQQLIAFLEMLSTSLL